MGTIGAGFSTSVDGFITGPGGDMQHLFAWLFGGDTKLVVPMGDQTMTLMLSEESLEVYRGLLEHTGAIISGRGMFDAAGGWGGRHPMNVPVFILTHEVPAEWAGTDAPFTFVTDGLESAVRQARAAAGDRNIAVGGADVTRQCLKAGLLDEIAIDLVPVLLGQGVRLFEHLGIEPVMLERTRVKVAPQVTHLRFNVVR
jgi:dihydrofolate reductase